jgi:hypothetical protein
MTPEAYDILKTLKALIKDGPEILYSVYGINIINPDLSPLDIAIAAWAESGCPMPDPPPEDKGG